MNRAAAKLNGPNNPENANSPSSSGVSAEVGINRIKAGGLGETHDVSSEGYHSHSDDDQLLFGAGLTSSSADRKNRSKPKADPADAPLPYPSWNPLEWGQNNPDNPNKSDVNDARESKHNAVAEGNKQPPAQLQSQVISQADGPRAGEVRDRRSASPLRAQKSDQGYNPNNFNIPIIILIMLLKHSSLLSKRHRCFCIFTHCFSYH